MVLGAAHALVVLPEAGQVLLDGEPQALLRRGSVTVDDVAAGRHDAAFAAGRSHTVPLGDRELWVRLQVRNNSTRLHEWYLDFVQPSIDEVTVFQQRGAVWTEQSAGDRVALGAWPQPGLYPRFRLHFNPGEERLLLVRVRNPFAAPMALRLIDDVRADLADQTLNLGYGVILGALALLLVGCLIQAILYRNATYFLCAVYTLLLGLTFASTSGLAGQYLWGNHPPWSDAAKVAFPLAAMGVSVWLVAAMCRVSTRGRALARISMAFGSAILLLALGLTLLGFRILWITQLAVVLTASLVCFIAISTWRRGDTMGAWVFAAQVPLIALLALVTARLSGWAPFRFDGAVLLSWSIAVTLPLLLVALYLQSKELLALQLRARSLRSTDALTGFLSAGLFAERVRAAVGRYRKSGHNAVVLYVRLVNCARIREMHGGAVAEQSVIRAAIKVQQLMPDADCIGRVGEETIGLILESVTSRSAIQECAARLVAHGLMPLKGSSPPVSLQFHAVANVLAENALDAAELSAALLGMLAVMSPRTHRPIRFLEPGASGATIPASPEPETGMSTDLT